MALPHFSKSTIHVLSHPWQTLPSQAWGDPPCRGHPALPSSMGVSQGQISSFAESFRARWCLSFPCPEPPGQAGLSKGAAALTWKKLRWETETHHTRTALFDVLRGELGFEISAAPAPNPKAKLSGTSPRRGRTEGMCSATPLKLQSRVTELWSAEPGGAGAPRFALWNL